MNDSKWNEIRELFHEVVELPKLQRDVFLTQNCPDQELRKEIEELLFNYEESSGFIEGAAIIESGFLEPEKTKIGEKIGNYEIIRELGRGGMGTVFLAERADDEFKQQVAIKIVKRGMDSDFIVGRFRNERQILASLNHPNIAKLFEGGTTADNLPYFVMEFVEGQNLIKYCNSKNLNIAERLNIFRMVCSAVEYAHQNLVIHRDLKPSNIIVKADGTPKLLDFGIAKILNHDTNEIAETTGIFRLLTPEYASPEQIRGDKITTTSDVYSLGVLLYELLTGQSPYQTKSKSYDEIVHAVCDTEPIEPSSAISHWNLVKKTEESENTTLEDIKVNPKSQIRNPKMLKGDLDNIIIKSLRKEPERRYSSVHEFSEDIRRHIQGFPVSAQPDNFSYRAQKFVKRHSVGVMSAILITLAMIGGVSATTWQSYRANTEKAKAEQRFNDLRKLTNSFLFEFEDAIKDLQGATPAREMTVKKALEYLDILVREQSNDPSLQFELGVAYSKIGTIQGYPSAANLGDTGGAVASYGKAIEIFEKLVKAEPDNLEFQKNLASNYASIAVIFQNTGDVELSASNNQAALARYQKLVERDEMDFSSKLALAHCYKSAGDWVASKGDLETSMQNYRKTLEISEAVVLSQPDNKKAKTMIMVASDAIGTTLGNPNFTNLGDTEGALQAYRRQLEICNEMLATDEKSQYYQAAKAFTLKVIGEVLAARNEWKAAIESYEESLEIQEKLVQNDAKDAFANNRLAYLLSNLGEALANTKKFDDALKHHNRAIEIFEKLVETDKENSSVVTLLSRAFQKKGDALASFGQEKEALTFYLKALKNVEDLAGEDLNNMDIRLQLANNYLQIARVNVRLANTSKEKKSEFLRESCKRFEQSKAVFLDMQIHDLRTKPISESLEKISKELAECE